MVSQGRTLSGFVESIGIGRINVQANEYRQQESERDMKRILITGDDGIFADGLWALADSLRRNFDILVVAPDRKQNAVGNSATVDRPFRVRKLNDIRPGVETWAIEGTPLDSIFFAAYKLAPGEISLVISGVNEGLNQNGDIYSSGTVSAAMTASMAGLPAVALSQELGIPQRLDSAISLAILLAQYAEAESWLSDLCLNINLPNLPLEAMKGIKPTRFISSGVYIDSVRADSSHGDGEHSVEGSLYWLVRQRGVAKADRHSDIWAVQNGYISITSLHTLLNRPPPPILHKLCSAIATDLWTDGC
jgi:5'-nucleotidase